jgi:LacI family transcriptional regulator
MQERVQASIDKIGYIPSIAAQRMSGSRSYLILALNDRTRTIEDWQARQGSDWIDQMLRGGLLKCAEHGYRLIFELVDTHNDHVERELKATIAALQPDGIILTPPHSDNPLITDLLNKANIPFAQIGSEGTQGGIPLIMGDEQAASDATEYLQRLGHTRIGFIAGPDSYLLSGWRTKGWRSAMEAAESTIDGLCGEGDFSLESGQAAALALLQSDDRPTAIIASNDQMAIGTIRAAEQMGLRVPDDLSVISFDNTPMARFTQPPLTAIDQPISETTSRAVELLIAAQKGEELPEEPTIVSADLIVRDSTAPLQA